MIGHNACQTDIWPSSDQTHLESISFATFFGAPAFADGVEQRWFLGKLVVIGHRSGTQMRRPKGWRSARHRAGPGLWRCGMNLGNVTPGKLHEGSLSMVGCIRRHKHARARGLRSGNCVRHTLDFIPGKLEAVRIRQMAIGNERRDLSK
jgi:hypothetical protein